VTTLGSGEYPTLCCGPDGMVYTFWVDGSDIKGQRLSPALAAIGGVYVAKTGVDSTGIDCAWVNGPKGAGKVALVWAEGGSAKIDASDTGFSS
jgi:hypothetical protein